MPEISRFYGIIVSMHYSDHPPPHFHARYAEHKAILEIETGVVLQGSIPARAHRLLVEWIRLHIGELRRNWELARQQAPLQTVDPLE